MHLDKLVEDIGSFGKFQIMVISLVYIPKLAIGYNVLMMTFGGYVPDWWCIDPTVSEPVNTTYQTCTTDNTNFTCHRIYENYTQTLVNKWDLVCDRKWIIPTITSIQFGGVLLGAMVGGQMADLFGRKKTFYATILLQSVFSITAAFSVSWQMFAVFRFCIGTTCGSYMVVCMFPVEFIGQKWRAAFATLPVWATGICFLALMSWVLHDWFYVQIVGGVLTIPFLLGWFIMPESIRWLTVKGRLVEAEKAVDMVARMNGKTKPTNTREILELIRQEEIAISGHGGRKYSYIDLYKGKMGKTSVFMQITWFCVLQLVTEANPQVYRKGLFCVSASYYGFAFGVGKFSGNFYLNLFLMNVLEYPFTVPIIVALNVFGRRRTGSLLFALSVVSCISVIGIQSTMSVAAPSRGTIITILSLAARISVGGAWFAMTTLCNEIYPTVIRNLGYGASNIAARVGGILAPFIFAASDNEMVPYITVVVILTISCLITLFLLPETLGEALEDVLSVESKVPSQQHKSQDDQNEIISLL